MRFELLLFEPFDIARQPPTFGLIYNKNTILCKKLNAKAQRPKAAKKEEEKRFDFHFGLKKYLPLLFAASGLCAFALNFFTLHMIMPIYSLRRATMGSRMAAW